MKQIEIELFFPNFKYLFYSFLALSALHSKYKRSYEMSFFGMSAVPLLSLFCCMCKWCSVNTWIVPNIFIQCHFSDCDLFHVTTK